MRIFSRHLLSLLTFSFLLALPMTSRAAVDVTITATIAPPPLPIYAQPAIPDDGYIWAPGYWAWGPEGYYWVPGTWVLPPAVGLLWTPGYWAWANGVYVWHTGYWGPHIGYYGGIDYGFGYTGTGYFGGYWDHGHFRYNRAVNNFGHAHVTNIYNRTIVNNVNITRNVTRVSFNGGRGGIAARPTAAEQAARHDQHVGPSNLQAQHEDAARGNHALLSSANHGRPAIAATPRPAAFTDGGVVGARGPRAASPNGAAPQTNTPHGSAGTHQPSPQAGPVPPRPTNSSEHRDSRQAPHQPRPEGMARETAHGSMGGGAPHAQPQANPAASHPPGPSASPHPGAHTEGPRGGQQPQHGDAGHGREGHPDEHGPDHH
jgi:hypothetical protein